MALAKTAYPSPPQWHFSLLANKCNHSGAFPCLSAYLPPPALHSCSIFTTGNAVGGPNSAWRHSFFFWLFTIACKQSFSHPVSRAHFRMPGLMIGWLAQSVGCTCLWPPADWTNRLSVIDCPFRFLFDFRIPVPPSTKFSFLLSHHISFCPFPHATPGACSQTAAHRHAFNPSSSLFGICLHFCLMRCSMAFGITA